MLKGIDSYLHTFLGLVLFFQANSIPEEIKDTLSHNLQGSYSSNTSLWTNSELIQLSSTGIEIHFCFILS